MLAIIKLMARREAILASLISPRSSELVSICTTKSSRGRFGFLGYGYASDFAGPLSMLLSLFFGLLLPPFFGLLLRFFLLDETTTDWLSFGRKLRLGGLRFFFSFGESSMSRVCESPDMFVLSLSSGRGLRAFS